MLGAALTLLSAATADAARKPRKRSGATADARRTVAREREFLGARCIVIAEGADSNHVSRTVERAFVEGLRLDRAIGASRDSSELAAVTRAPSQTRVPLSADFCEVLARALEIAEETDGAFDPTVGPLARAWDVRGKGRVPDSDEIAAARSSVGWRRVRLDVPNRTVWFQRDSMALDFGGIGRGFALDRMERTLRAAGIERALIRFGNDALAMSDGAGWMVRVPHPVEPRPLVDLAVRTGAVSTAAAESHDVFDPVRGAPVAGSASVTVVTRSGVRAEALATALLVMGREAAERFAAEHEDIGVLWLEPHHQEVWGWKWNLPSAATTAGASVDWRH